MNALCADITEVALICREKNKQMFLQQGNSKWALPFHFLH